MERFIEADRSLIAAADFYSLPKLREFLEALRDVPNLKAIKTGFLLGYCDLKFVVNMIKRTLGPEMLVIHDHQKAGTDIPEMGEPFADMLKQCGVDAAILFPQAGPETQTAWTLACQSAGLRVMVGGMMTHKRYVESEGGYLADWSPQAMFELACEQGVRDFVVPGTKIQRLQILRDLLEVELGEGAFDLYAPGFISQGGSITACGNAAGKRFHAIVGRPIYEKRTVAEMHTAAIECSSQLGPV